jgi:hypothetical protein
MGRLIAEIGRGRKKVWGSDPYTSPKAYQELYADGEPELQAVIAAWIDNRRSIPLSPLLLGEPGVGMHRLAVELAQRTGKPLYILQGHEDIPAEYLACAVRFGDGDAVAIDYVVSPLVTAMHEGGICFIDQISKIRPRAMALLVSVLDERRSIDSNLLGERIEAAAGFRFLASTNTGEIHALPDFIRSRMRPVIRVGETSPTQGDKTRKIQPGARLTHAMEEPLNQTFWSLWQSPLASNPVPRELDAIRLIALATSLGDFDNPDDLKASQTGLREGRMPAEEIRLTTANLEIAFQELFGQEPQP